MSTVAEEERRTHVPWWRAVLGVVSVGVAGVVVPGGGLVLALIFFFTVFKHYLITKWLVVGLGVFLLLGALFAFGPVASQGFESSEGVVSN